MPRPPRRAAEGSGTVKVGDPVIRMSSTKTLTSAEALALSTKRNLAVSKKLGKKLVFRIVPEPEIVWSVPSSKVMDKEPGVPPVPPLPEVSVARVVKVDPSAAY